jgi:hypothetical protein
MSYLDRIAACRIDDMSAYRRFIVDGVPLGWVKDDFAACLRDFPEVFRVADDAVGLAPGLTGFKARTEAVDAAVRALKARGAIEGWFEEKFPAKLSHGAEPVFDIERAAVSMFGLPSFGVHMNGFVLKKDGLHMWVAERAHGKPIEPGKLDQLVAGGQPADLSVAENLVKECEEEAMIPPALAAQARPVSAITYRMERPEGLRCDVIYAYDLMLDPEFEPVNADGEVHAFHLWPIDKVAAIVRDTDDFKFNCSLVVIDFLIRHGYLAPDHPEYVDCVRGLRA